MFIVCLFTDCVEEQYLFGRDSKCNYVLDDPDDRGSKKFRIYSKKHFRIYRVRPLLLHATCCCYSLLIICDLRDSTLRQEPVCLTCDLSPCQEDSQVFVEDYSNNGTFVDGILIGKDKKLPLVNNAVLSLAEQRNKGQRHNSGSEVSILGETNTQCSHFTSTCLCLCLQSLSSST